jgi:hypothetical protein
MESKPTIAGSPSNWYILSIPRGRLAKFEIDNMLQPSLELVLEVMSRQFHTESSAPWNNKVFSKLIVKPTLPADSPKSIAKSTILVPEERETTASSRDKKKKKKRIGQVRDLRGFEVLFLSNNLFVYTVFSSAPLIYVPHPHWIT